MQRKLIKWALAISLALGIVLTIIMLCNEIQKMKDAYIIKDPMVVYSDYSIERFDARNIYGRDVYGIISEAKLKELLGVKSETLLHEMQ